jgi:membrane fusion protein (multidrug efflux system)
VQLPEYRTLEHRISYVGTVFARQEVPIIARVQGTLVELAFGEGESFSAGTELARLESPELEATVERLQAEVDYWTSRHETDSRLVEQRALAPEQADASHRALRTAQAGLDEARAQLAKTVVTAPFDGTVLDWPAEIGQPVMPGQPLILIGDVAREIRVDVVEEDLYRGIVEGTPVELNLAAGRVVSATVSSVAPAAKGVARTFTVTIALPDIVPLRGGPETGSTLSRRESDRLLRKGASIRTDFIVERTTGGLTVPLRAMADRDGAPYLYVISNDVAHRRPVSLGISRGGWIVAEFEWNGSDPVAVTNLNTLYDGAPVYPVSTPDSAVFGGSSVPMTAGGN